MKIYKITQSVNNDYDTYDSFVVYAKDEEQAKLVRPLNEKDDNYGDWVKSTDDIEVEYLGDAKPDAKKGIILGSFNAG